MYSLYVPDTALTREVNRLWMAVYPTLARFVALFVAGQPKRILETGCFSGGTGIELLKLYPEARLTVACGSPELAENFRQDWIDLIDAGIEGRFTCCTDTLDSIAAGRDGYDLVFCRGVFFFLDDEAAVLSDLAATVAPGGCLVAGGGYGPDTPDEVIAAIADESRDKNNALGRRLVTVDDFRRSIARAGLEDRAEISEQGGLWAIIRN